ncbi:hypothetical protein NDS46_30675 (plasmid) [Paenibacillus thiaminolyticus]|uniref:hypothetical protein n=1 Tax=Paenibacillus thiaminolyticus TaxID=49283 RepID=UPI00232C8FA8|nr:hypothetical protein [Paenibacillus thiaminolyticus]WCF11713.1 hypothetical protein NDS46_30675 [Paenibacillus thiaminolyticus]
MNRKIMYSILAFFVVLAVFAHFYKERELQKSFKIETQLENHNTPKDNSSERIEILDAK